MKKTYKTPADGRRSFYILKYGSFLVIVMLCVTMLYYASLIENDVTGEVKFFYALPLARAMLEHCAATFAAIVGVAMIFGLKFKN